MVAQGRESRSLECEVRFQDVEGATGTVSGYAAVFDSWSPWYGWDADFREQIAPGAFDGFGSNDVRGLFNHDPNKIFASTSSGTLRLRQDDHGLHFEGDLGDTELDRFIRDRVKRGLVKGASFSFTVAEEIIENDKETGKMSRTITRVGELFDVGPVSFPFYPDTSVAARAVEKRMVEVKRAAGMTHEFGTSALFVTCVDPNE